MNTVNTSRLVPEGLKSCPLCGRDVAIVGRFHASRPATMPWTAHINCRFCCLSYSTSSFYATEPEAIRQVAINWNMRRDAESETKVDGFTRYLTLAQKTAFQFVATSLLVDTRKNVFPTEPEAFFAQLQTQLRPETLRDRSGLIRLAAWLVHGIMLLSAETARVRAASVASGERTGG